MIALDTNVLARYLLGDEPSQTQAARALLEDATAEYWIPITVVLELSWVLRKAEAPRARVIEKLRDLLSLQNMRPQNADQVFQALRWAAQGMDLADALHLVMSSSAVRFATFDEALALRGVRCPGERRNGKPLRGPRPYGLRPKRAPRGTCSEVP